MVCTPTALDVQRVVTREMAAQERAALVTMALVANGKLSVDAIQRISGLSYSGAYYMMTKLSRVLPIVYDYEAREWAVME